ncbi:hypothetical protein [Alistipes sp. ZOR0009]|uniref:hypothetical protein n=1 Tax=Alistipes sp. ZOR0009 TaxID=1339253 RepID=UPI0006470506|nr:hypothetical protein [Alistipes sp. ZOR0009]
MNKKIIIIGVVVIAVIAAFFFLRKDTEPIDLPAQPTPAPTPTPTPAPKAMVTPPALLKADPFLSPLNTPAKQAPKLTAANYAKALRPIALSKTKQNDDKVKKIAAAAAKNGIRFDDVKAAYYNIYKSALIANLSGKVTTQTLFYLDSLS